MLRLSDKSSSRIKELGIGGAIVAIVLSQVFSFLMDFGAIPRAPVPTNPSAMDVESREMFTRMAADTRRLYEMHDRRDEDGVPLWYVPRSMTKAVEEQTKVLQELHMSIKEQTRAIERGQQ